MATGISQYEHVAINGLREVFDNITKLQIQEITKLGLFDIQNTVEDDEIWTSENSMEGPGELSDIGTPVLVSVEDGYQISSSKKRWGSGILIDERMRAQSQSKLKKLQAFLDRQRNKLLKTNKLKFLNEIHKLFNLGFSSETSPDGEAIFSASHTWNDSNPATFDNLVIGALDSGVWDEIERRGGAFTDSQGNQMPINFDTIHVKKGGSAHREAKRLFLDKIVPVTTATINIYQGMSIKVVANPYITSDTAYFATASMEDNPLKVNILKNIGLRPPKEDDNEGIRINCTGFYDYLCVNSPYAILGSVGVDA